MKFKKGQIVPRWTGLKANDRKAQHHLKFGADVSFEGGVFYIESDGSVFTFNKINRKMKNGTFKSCHAAIGSCVRINGERVVKQSNCSFITKKT